MSREDLSDRLPQYIKDRQDAPTFRLAVVSVIAFAAYLGFYTIATSSLYPVTVSPPSPVAAAILLGAGVGASVFYKHAYWDTMSPPGDSDD